MRGLLIGVTTSKYVYELLKEGFKCQGINLLLLKNDPSSLIKLKNLFMNYESLIIFRDIFNNKDFELLIYKMLDKHKLAIIDLEDDLLIHRIIKYKNILYFKRELPKDILNKKVLYRLILDIIKIKHKDCFLNLYNTVTMYKSNIIFPFPLTYFDNLFKNLSNKKRHTVSYIVNLHFKLNIFNVLTRGSVWKKRIKIARIVSKYPACYVRVSSTPSYNIEHGKYLEILSSSLCSIAPHSISYDTFRYWEIPFAGTVLIAEKPLNIIPNNLIEGKHAFFFKSLGELKSIIEYVISDTDLAIKIGKEARDFVLRYHSPKARVEYLVNIIQSSL
jgi:hypothetical protein